MGVWIWTHWCLEGELRSPVDVLGGLTEMIDLLVKEIKEVDRLEESLPIYLMETSGRPSQTSC